MYNMIGIRYSDDAIANNVHAIRSICTYWAYLNINIFLTHNNIHECIKSSFLIYCRKYCNYLNRYNYICNRISYRWYHLDDNDGYYFSIENPNSLNFDIDITKPFKLNKLIENVI